MPNKNLTPFVVAKEYAAAIKFNNGVDLYDCVKTNENFFIGKCLPM